MRLLYAAIVGRFGPSVARRHTDANVAAAPRVWDERYRCVAVRLFHVSRTFDTRGLSRDTKLLLTRLS
jgi:hypothetical protein